MTHTAKHTPTGEVMAHFNLSDEEWDGLPSFMQQKLATVYCQHAAAPAVYDALYKLMLEAIHYRNTGGGEQFLTLAIEQAKAALAQADGKQ